MSVRRKVRIALLVCTCILAAVITAVLSYEAYLSRTIKELRGDLAAIAGNRSSLADVQRLKHKYSRFAARFEFHVSSDNTEFSVDPNSCTIRQCGVAFEIDNFVLAKLGVVRAARFSATVVVLDDRVAYMNMSLFSGPDGFNGGIVDFVPCCTAISESVPLGAQSAYSFPTPAGKPYLRVRITDKATSEQITRATALNTGCFLSRSPCDWPCQYLPLAWRDYAQNVSHDNIALWENEGMRCGDSW